MSPTRPSVVSRSFPAGRSGFSRQLCRGQTLVEYAFILAIIALVAVAVLMTLGQQTKTFYSVVASQISRAGSG